MPKEFVFVVLSRWTALAPVLFSVIMVLFIVYTFRSGRPSGYRAVMRLFTLVCCSASVISCFFIAYHISQGYPIQTSSEKIIS
jgi:dolichyl-phosphate-mannose--protein O-mannosyl transferase